MSFHNECPTCEDRNLLRSRSEFYRQKCLNQKEDIKQKEKQIEQLKQQLKKAEESLQSALMALRLMSL